MKTLFKISIAFIIPVVFFITGCEKKNTEEVIVFDNSYPLALSPNVEWAVVNDPYAAYRKESTWESAVSGHCRKGDILMVNGKSVDMNKDVWYFFENGWLPENCLTVYSNRLKAKSASEKLTGNEK